MRRFAFCIVALLVVSNFMGCQQEGKVQPTMATKDSDEYYQKLVDKGVEYYRAYNVDSFADCNKRIHQYLMRNEGRKDEKYLQLKAHWLKAEGVYYTALLGRPDSGIVYTDSAIRLMERLRMDPELRVILTVSPIRHIADGLDTNSLSKAALRVAINEAIARHREYCDYFPAYEIMLDDLRDYRFYSSDMVHPSDVAVEYIWQAFQATYLDDRSALAVSRCERIHKRLQHRPMSANRETVDRFNADTASVVRNLIKEYPYLAQHPQLQKALQAVN